jgi:hypothetical protein
MAARLPAARTGPALFPGIIIFLLLILISVRDSVNPQGLVRPEGLGKLTKRITSSGLEPDTFRLVA